MPKDTDFQSLSVCIDGSPLLVRSAGVKTYIYHWLRSLRAVSPDAIRSYLASVNGRLNHAGGPPHRLIQLAILSVLNRTGGVLADLAAPKCDVFHVSNLLRYPPLRPKLSATVHDLTSWIIPECRTSGDVRSDKEFARRILTRADGLIAVSENTRQDAIRILNIDPDKIRVIYHGVPESYFLARKSKVSSKPYVLFVGTIEPRKNVMSLLTAWASLPAPFRAEHRLRIAGMKGWNVESTMRRLAQMTRDDASVEYLGYVPEENMPSLVAGACALVYPSLYEGFGIPVAQAMAAGCPVITSHNSSLREVAGDAAILIDPRSVAEIAGAIRRVAESPTLRDDLRLRGVERAKRFTWERAAIESLRYFADISSSSRIAAGD
jgi:glycosyltransferase involved in cell wall biosynthesis